MQTISPSLWFGNQAEDAAGFYVSVFDESRILEVSRYAAGGPGPAGAVITAEFEID